ncbi:hypothetical protein GWK47_048910 [Chionoecetes opilio]|uniref:Saposin B-type domain-containing protein n=1 Tax=Chionoecetes opilio TaxID=41210 RepID=A0A8J4Y4U8_CHIOP|nr:hypothetical protein GWK47_048910 [Chionoecetes opilio]
MKLPHNILLSATFFVCIIAKGDLDFIDTESNGDSQTALKCDACRIIAEKFSEAFSELKEEGTATGRTTHDEDIINAAEGVCDDAWLGGEGTFTACSSDDWGPWPGDDYDDYEDALDFDGIHDEF